MEIVGTTKVTKGWKISLIKDVRNELNAKLGDKLVYKRTNDGMIVLEKT